MKRWLINHELMLIKKVGRLFFAGDRNKKKGALQPPPSEYTHSLTRSPTFMSMSP